MQQGAEIASVIGNLALLDKRCGCNVRSALHEKFANVQATNPAEKTQTTIMKGGQVAAK
jgi:hypothetical protein